MKDFLKMTFATLLGLLLFGFVATFVAFGIIGSMALLNNTPAIVEPHTVFELELEGTLVERNQESGIDFLKSKYSSSQAVIGLDEVLTAIERAKENANVEGIYLNIGGLSAAPASIEEIRNALTDFKSTGKFVAAYADDYGNGTYALATVADLVALNPHGQLGLTGLAMNTLFYQKALDKLGIEMQVFRVGTFKSAVEPYIDMHMSEANRLQMNQLSASIWNTLRSDMANGRQLDKTLFDDFANEGLFFADADEAYKRNLVDTLVYRIDMEKILEQLMHGDYATADLNTMKKQPDEAKYVADKIAVVYATGEIDGTGNDYMDSEEISATLADLADDKAMKAVVLRVNSPGGSAFGSEQMWHATQLVKANKPLVVSMGDYAASGGYYMSCAADVIVAQPTTITGSIGIFGLLPNVEKLADKIGIAVDGVKTHEYADFGNVSRPVTAAEKQAFQRYVERGYELFVSRCAEGRHRTTDEIKQVAEGRVWTGADALTIGLIDTLGNLNDAIGIAAAKAGLTEYNVRTYPTKRDWITQLLDDLEMRTLQKRFGANYKLLIALQKAQTRQGAQAIMPFDISFE